MAKFLKAPVEEPTPPPEPVVEVVAVPLWQDPVFHQAMAIFVLTALATVFIILLFRGILMKDRKPGGTPAALSGHDYTGVGLKSGQDAREKPSVLRK